MRRVYTLGVLGLSLLMFGVAATTPPACPADMVLVSATQTCIDRFEWPNQAGVKPLLALSATLSPFDADRGLTQLNIETLCASVGKRPCEYEEWVAACRGRDGADYPFGRTLPKLKSRDDAPCNYAKLYQTVDEQKVFWRDPVELARLDQSDPAGARSCTSASGAEDMMGNAEEWIRCPSWVAGQVGWCLAGRYWSDPEPCDKMATGHDPRWHYYETGGRCCL